MHYSSFRMIPKVKPIGMTRLKVKKKRSVTKKWKTKNLRMKVNLCSGWYGFPCLALPHTRGHDRNPLVWNSSPSRRTVTDKTSDLEYRNRQLCSSAMLLMQDLDKLFGFNLMHTGFSSRTYSSSWSCTLANSI